ncbi:MAG: sigma-70 family RNA polymerase sigma factor [Marinilabiliales bacterium]|nr:MAG: sigma-70 family RNA polymerase sigma factor [Marinilabiliales bacterium]
MTELPFVEDEVIASCRRNDRRAQEVLYRHFAKKMYGICLGYAGERPMAQDILQESFIKVFRNIAQYKQDGSLEGWIRRIVVNTAIDHIRKRKRSYEYIDSEPADNSLHIQNHALKMMGYKEIMQQVQRLPEGARLIFSLYAVDGYTHKEIAEKLEITEGTSKSQFNRARKLLMGFLGNMNL